MLSERINIILENWRKDQSRPLLLVECDLWEESNVESLVEALKKYDYIATLDLSRNNINNETVMLLAKLNNVGCMILDENDIRADGARALAASNITSLSLNGNHLQEAGGKALLATRQTAIIIDRDTAIPEDLRAKIQEKAEANKHSKEATASNGNYKIPQTTSRARPKQTALPGDTYNGRERNTAFPATRKQATPTAGRPRPDGV
ncbi:MAG: hypothetical protein CMF39_03405 [Legionellaceae bacterium]|nr:hypothetical protein [Legionellaceae bacterium]|tara:strand:+ start:481 stop:1098 length:618 start_codon:yes stop_codon:yes gene_type:complete